jgi:hypothetical protein
VPEGIVRGGVGTLAGGEDPMTTLKLEFAMDNAAFDDGGDGRFEATRLLREVADRLEEDELVREDGRAHGSIRDTNGNVVGGFEIVDS